MLKIKIMDIHKKLIQEKGNAKVFKLKSGKIISAGIGEINKEEVKLFSSDAMKLMAEATKNNKPTQQIIDNKNNFTMILISDIESIS